LADWETFEGVDVGVVELAAAFFFGAMLGNVGWTGLGSIVRQMLWWRRW
jgi:hypothetical protein